MSYEIQLSPSASRALARLRRSDSTAAKRIVLKLEELAKDPRPAGASALKGRPGELRVRVGGYRIVYEVQDRRLIVLVLAIGHRSSIYD